MQSGFDALMNHTFFSSIDWPLLESKQLSPPYIPHNETLECISNKSVYIPKSLPQLLKEINKFHWAEEFNENDINTNNTIDNANTSIITQQTGHNNIVRSLLIIFIIA